MGGLPDHRSRYGRYGIVLKRAWAIDRGACKAIYVAQSGPVFEAFSSLFNTLAPAISSFGDPALDAWIDKLGRTKSEFAKSLGSPEYAELLKLHSFMQTDEHVAESEWRIIRNHEFGWSEGMPLKEVKAHCLAMAVSGISQNLSITPNAVEFLICPQIDLIEFQKRLPAGWSNVPIRVHNDP